MWETPGRQEDRYSYRHANKAARKTVATAKARAMNVLYEELETPEGERNIYLSDNEGPRQNEQGFHKEQSDKGRTMCSFKGPGYDQGKMEGRF